MYYVDMYNEQDQLICHTPFEDKNLAIKYFNLRTDGRKYNFVSFKRIEILNDDLVLFDYEV